MRYSQKQKYEKKRLGAYRGEPKFVISDKDLKDDTIYCDMQTGKIKTGTIHFSDEFITECAERLAYFLLDNPSMIKNEATTLKGEVTNG